MTVVGRRQVINEAAFQGWLSPSGEFHETKGFGHRDWVEKSFPGENPDRKMFQLLAAGWVRKSGPDAYEIGDEKHLPLAVRHAKEHHPEVSDLTVDVTPSWKTSHQRVWRVPVMQPGRKRLFSEARLEEGGATKEMRQLIKRAEREGWSAEKTRKGHWRLTHPNAATPVIAPGTPSDHRFVNNVEAELRRALRRGAGGEVSTPAQGMADMMIKARLYGQRRGR